MATRESTRVPRTFKCADSDPSSSRNLVVCIDGTSNQFCTKNTNIVELYSHITKNDRQLTYYSSGLGTVAKVSSPSIRQQLSNGLDMAIGRNLHKVIMTSYRWLSDNYRDGDRIFLFGYSRGAYQVRALAGMISRVGLLLPGNNEQIPFAFELYSKTADDDSSLARPASVISQPVTKESEQRAEYSKLAKTFQKTFCRGTIHIHFLGVWDTVSSVGMGRGKTLPSTTTSCEHICYFRHALALDERRVKFLPEYVFGGRSSCCDDGRIKEVWFAGSHADVGGGNRRNESLQSGDIPLLWMRSQAIAAGLIMEPADVMWKIDDLNKRITPSLSTAWWFLELLPLPRLLYYNSSRQTIRPHLGDPRRILPGQKVHVSVLFKNNYRPWAQFYNNPEAWPEPMFWNDESSHQRLQELPDTWDKDIFDRSSVRTLLDDLQPGNPNLDALDRLGIMASFDICKRTMYNDEKAKQILGTFLNSPDPLIHLSTAVTFCELAWAQEWHLDTTHAKLGKQITEGISKLLNEEEHRRRACIYLPSLCKWTDLRPQLMSDENLKTLVELCDNIRVGKYKEGTSTVAFHSAQALFMLMKLDENLAVRLIELEVVGDITEALRSNCKPVLVSALNVLNGLAKHRLGRSSMGPSVATLLKLVMHSDDFVAPAAARVICSLLPDDDLRFIMLRFGVLSIFVNMLDRRSYETKQVACWALVHLVGYDDVRQVLSKEGYLKALAKRVQNHLPSKCDGAISALEVLSDTQVSKAVTNAVEEAKIIPVLVARLNHKSTALSAAIVLARLVKINDVAIMVSEDNSGARVGIVNMLQHRWFDGVNGEDGLQILSELLECDSLRSAVLSAGAIGTLREMINPAHYESTYAGLHYLRVITKFDKNGKGPLPSETPSLIPHIISALRLPHRRVQRIAIEILRFLFTEGSIGPENSTRDLRTLIVDNLLGLLLDRHAHVLLAANTLLCFLASDKYVRDKVVMERAFWNLSEEYYSNNGLTLEYIEKSRGPRVGEVYQSVRQMIKVMQSFESDDPGTTSLEDSNEAAMEMDLDRDKDRDKDWFLVAAGPVLYEPVKKKKWATYWTV